MKFFVFTILALGVISSALGQDLLTRSLRLRDGGVLTTLNGSATGGTYTLPDGGGTLITTSSGVLYGPSAQQTTLTTNSSYLFDVAYGVATVGSVLGARIQSTAGGNGANATGLTVVSSAPTGVNTIASFVGSNGSVIIDGRNASLSNAQATLSLKGARSGVNAFSEITFSNFDNSGAQADNVVADIQAVRSVTDGASLRFHTGTAGVLNTAPSLVLTDDGMAGIGMNNPNTKLDIDGDLSVRVKPGGAVVLAAGTNTLDATGRSYIVVTSDALGSTITDITGGFNGKILYLYNRTGPLTIADNVGTVVTDGIFTNTTNDITTTGRGMVTLIYSSNVDRWLVMSFLP